MGYGYFLFGLVLGLYIGWRAKGSWDLKQNTELAVVAEARKRALQKRVTTLANIVRRIKNAVKVADPQQLFEIEIGGSQLEEKLHTYISIRRKGTPRWKLQSLFIEIEPGRNPAIMINRDQFGAEPLATLDDATVDEVIRIGKEYIAEHSQ